MCLFSSFYLFVNVCGAGREHPDPSPLFLSGNGITTFLAAYRDRSLVDRPVGIELKLCQARCRLNAGWKNHLSPPAPGNPLKIFFSALSASGVFPLPGREIFL